MAWTTARWPISEFEVGDYIGYNEAGNQPRGEIITSEPMDIGDDQWHLAWRQDDAPGKVFHYRGPATQRDTRWFIENRHIIHEQP